MSGAVLLFDGLGLLALAGVAVYLALRNGGLREEVAELKGHLEKAEATALDMSRQYATYRAGSEGQKKALRKTIKELEIEIDRYNVPGAVRSQLNRLFAQATGRGDPTAVVVPEPSGAAADGADDPLRGPE